MLNKELPKKGVQSEQCVWEKWSKDDKTWPLVSNLKWRYLNYLITKLERVLSVQSLFYLNSWRLLLMKRFRAADLVHYHLIHNFFFSLLSIPFLTRVRPTVWTIHDPWVFTGRCVYQLGCEGWRTGCGVCPDLTTFMWAAKDHSAFMWKVKKLIYRWSKLEFIVASPYMQRMAKESPLTKNHRVHLVPFGIDLNVFKPGDKLAAQKRLGVIPGSYVVSLRANHGLYKGCEYIAAALRDLKTDRPICLLSCEERGVLDQFRGRYQLIDLGWLKDEPTMVDMYNASDLFLMPSVAEAFGMMAMESMACGTPVVVADGTSLPEVIHAPRGGIVVPPRDAVAIRKTIEYYMQNESEQEQIGVNARQVAEEYYGLDKHLDRMVEVYKDVLSRARQ